jgi:protein TonB
MEIKKSPKADLEGKKQLSLLMGYVVALAVIFVAFEWGSRDIVVAESAGVGDIFVEEEIEITRPEDTPPPVVEPPKQVVIEILNEVEDDVEVEEQEILSSEDDQSAAQVQVFTPPVVEEEEEDTNQIFTVVEKAPLFPGGETEMMKYISSKIKYPVIAAENGIQGRVICSFIVNKDGKIVDAVVLRGVDSTLDKEALRVINSMPAWSPGEQRGKPVRVKYTLPVLFRLQN